MREHPGSFRDHATLPRGQLIQNGGLPVHYRAEVQYRKLLSLAKTRADLVETACHVGRGTLSDGGGALGGRTIPLVWATYTEGQLYRIQNSYEERLLRLLV